VTPVTVGAAIHSNRGTIYVTYSVVDQGQPPVDLRSVGQHLQDCWTLSSKPVPVMFLLGSLAGGALFLWTILGRRRGRTPG